MGLFKKLHLNAAPAIDWDMTPEYTFGTFESWGGKERIRNNSERIYYFFIDGWGDKPKLRLMERGVKHARVLADISAPDDLVFQCVKKQGKAVFDKNFAIDEQLKRWLIANVVETNDESKIIPLRTEVPVESKESGLPRRDEAAPPPQMIHLPAEYADLSEEEVCTLVRQYDLVDQLRNKDGRFRACLVDDDDGMTVTDLLTGLMWQRDGIDIMSHRMLRAEVQKINDRGLAGQTDWRLPSLAEALSLMTPEKNAQGLYLHPCFSPQQPFILVNATRRTGGYWFVDYKQGRVFWASGTIPGGFGRLCRKEK